MCAGYSDVLANETAMETDEYDEIYAEPDFSFMYEFGTEEQVILIFLPTAYVSVMK